MINLEVLIVYQRGVSCDHMHHARDQLSRAPPSIRARRLSTVAPGCILGLGAGDSAAATALEGAAAGADAFEGVVVISAGAVVPRTPRVSSSTSSSLPPDSPLLPMASEEGRMVPRSSSELFLPRRVWNLGAGRLAGEGELWKLGPA